MSDIVHIPMYLRPLVIPTLDEYMSPDASVKDTEVSLAFLGDLLNDRQKPVATARDRYEEVTDTSLEPVASPDHPVIKSVIWPLLEAKCCYVLAMPVACIAQAGLVGEMVAIWRFRMLEQELDGRPLDKKLQKQLFGSAFDKLGQRRRVKVLHGLEVLDDEIKEAFDRLRELRNKYLHNMVDPLRDKDADARRAYEYACKLVTKTLGLKITTGAFVLPPKVLRFIQSLEKTDAEKTPSSEEG